MKTDIHPELKMSDDLIRKLSKKAVKIWNFSDVRIKYPHSKFLLQKDLGVCFSVNKIGSHITRFFPDLIAKHSDKEVLICSVLFIDERIKLSVADVNNGEILETKYLQRGYLRGINLNFYSVKITSVDEVEARIIYEGKNNIRNSVKEELSADHFILFAFDEED